MGCATSSPTVLHPGNLPTDLPPPASAAPNAKSVDSATSHENNNGSSISPRPRALEDAYDVDWSLMLGKGHYGKVFKGVSRNTGGPVAVKVLDRSKSRLERLETERDILAHVSHKNIVKLLDVFETPAAFIFVLEFMGGGEIFEYLVNVGPLTEHDASVCVGELADALQYLHSRGIVHRDIKPENLLLSERVFPAPGSGSETPRAFPLPRGCVVKLVDFGLAAWNRASGAAPSGPALSATTTTTTGDGAGGGAPAEPPPPAGAAAVHTMRTVCGTWAYSAPEVRIFRRPYTEAVDLWSLGVVLFVLLVSFHPFDPQGDATQEVMQANIASCKYDFEDAAWAGISEDAKSLIRALLQVDPAKRLDAAGVLSHPWVVEHAALKEQQQQQLQQQLSLSPLQGKRSFWSQKLSTGSTSMIADLTTIILCRDAGSTRRTTVSEANSHTAPTTAESYSGVVPESASRPPGSKNPLPQPQSQTDQQQQNQLLLAHQLAHLQQQQHSRQTVEGRAGVSGGESGTQPSLNPALGGSSAGGTYYTKSATASRKNSLGSGSGSGRSTNAVKKEGPGRAQHYLRTTVAATRHSSGEMMAAASSMPTSAVTEASSQPPPPDAAPSYASRVGIPPRPPSRGSPLVQSPWNSGLNSNNNNVNNVLQNRPPSQRVSASMSPQPNTTTVTLERSSPSPVVRVQTDAAGGVSSAGMAVVGAPLQTPVATTRAVGSAFSPRQGTRTPQTDCTSPSSLPTSCTAGQQQQQQHQQPSPISNAAVLSPSGGRHEGLAISLPSTTTERSRSIDSASTTHHAQSNSGHSGAAELRVSTTAATHPAPPSLGGSRSEAPSPSFVTPRSTAGEDTGGRPPLMSAPRPRDGRKVDSAEVSMVRQWKNERNAHGGNDDSRPKSSFPLSSTQHSTGDAAQGRKGGALTASPRRLLRVQPVPVAAVAASADASSTKARSPSL